jgi:hypothetical protein
MKALRIRHYIITAAISALVMVAAEAENATDDLDPRVRGLLQEEMREIEAAMQTILSAIVRGQHDVVQERGQAIHNSFIMAQSLSEEDRRSLRAALPDGFVELDQAFHALAAELAERGAEKDTSTQINLFQQMTESCLQCHRSYASERFSGLRQ